MHRPSVTERAVSGEAESIEVGWTEESTGSG